MPQRRIHRDHLRVSFAVDQAWKSIKRRTSHAGAGVHGFSVHFIQQDAERQREWVMAQPLEIIEQLLNPCFVAHWWITIGGAGRTFRRIYSVLPVDVI